MLLESKDVVWIVNGVVGLEKEEDGRESKKKNHLRSLRAYLLVVACFTTQRAKVDPFWAVFVPTADAVHLWPSGLSPDKRRFKRDRRNCLDVDRDDAKLVDPPKCTYTPLVDAEGRDINTCQESSGACMHARVAKILEFHAGTLSFQGSRPAMPRFLRKTGLRRLVQRHVWLQASFRLPYA